MPSIRRLVVLGSEIDRKWRSGNLADYAELFPIVIQSRSDLARTEDLGLA
jgi:hypothetical protein